MHNKITRREFAAATILSPFGASLFGTSLLRSQQIESGIRDGIKAVRIAVPEFKPTAPDAKINRLAEIFNQTLWDDLDFSGGLVLVSRSFYPLGNFSTPSDIRPADWTKAGVEAQFITYGNLSIPASGNMKGQFSAELHLMNARLSQETIGVRWGGGLDTEDAARFLAHNWSNAILENLGFGKGVAMTKIAYVSQQGNDKEISIMDYDGNGAFQLTAIRNLALTPAWSPDGSRIAFTSNRGSGNNIEVVTRSDGRSVPFPASGSLNMTPAWSPNGQRIAFASGRGNGGTEIYLADANGRSISRLMPRASTGHVGDLSPVWNPATGRQLAFVSDRSGSQQIYRVNDDGTNLTRIINDGGDAENPSWRPDGNFLAFAWKKAGNGRYDIYIHDLVTGRNTQLTQNAGDNEKPTWSPDGNHIAFESNRTGKLQIYSMLADGSKPRQLTRSGENKAPAWSGYIK